jgi:4-carboxymuconolactone decarboxylase
LSDTNDDRIDRGRESANHIYGGTAGNMMVEAGMDPFNFETVAHLFGEVWTRPGLSIRDRRLLVLGATAALGRKEMIQIQAHGALISGDLKPDELDEAALQLAYYVGWPNGAAFWQGIVAAKKAHAAGEPQRMGQ